VNETLSNPRLFTAIRGPGWWRRNSGATGRYPRPSWLRGPIGATRPAGHGCGGPCAAGFRTQMQECQKARNDPQGGQRDFNIAAGASGTGGR